MRRELLDVAAEATDLATEVTDFAAQVTHLAAQVTHLAAEFTDIAAQSVHIAPQRTLPGGEITEREFESSVPGAAGLIHLGDLLFERLPAGLDGLDRGAVL